MASSITTGSSLVALLTVGGREAADDARDMYAPESGVVSS